MSSILAEPATPTRDAAFLAATPAQPLVDPPPGVLPCPHCSNGNGGLLIAITVIGMVIALVCTMIRMYTKAFLTRAMGWDDCMSSPWDFVLLKLIW